MATAWRPLLAEAQALLKDAKHFDGVMKLDSCMELFEAEVGGSERKIFKDPAEFVAHFMPKLSAEQKASLRQMYEVRGELLSGLGALKRAAALHGCAATLDPDSEEAKRARIETSEEVAPPPAKRARPSKLPVAILTGYLGAGKTTLLNYVLHEQRDKKLAVIENEIGEVSIDDALVEQKHDLAEELVVLDNGCICCTIRGDLVKTLKDLAKKVADGQKLDGVLIELTGAADPAPVVQTFMVDEDARKAFSIDNVIALVDAKHAVEKLDESKGDPAKKGTACAQIAFASTVLLNKVDLVDADTLAEAEKRIKALNRSVDIIRCEQAKAPLDRLFNVGAFDLAKVLEEQYMDEEEFNTFYKPKMDNSISNVGVKFEGAINLEAFQLFLGKYLNEEETAKDFLRVKGVLNVITSDRMFVVQCVHMLKNQSFTKPWPQRQPRENRVIFIGRGMEQRRAELTEGTLACVAKPLRFPVGAEVMAKTGGGEADRTPGRVIKHWDDFYPYRIKLHNGDEVHAPVDSDDFVMAP